MGWKNWFGLKRIKNLSLIRETNQKILEEHIFDIHILSSGEEIFLER